jgi:hypothetical protein
MLKVLFHILFFLMGFTLTLGIMGGVLCSLQKHSSKLYKQIIGELFIFGIICILVVTLTIVIIKPYA